jgi:hypothetical protein
MKKAEASASAFLLGWIEQKAPSVRELAFAEQMTEGV